jgi:hypothetical protein
MRVLLTLAVTSAALAAAPASGADEITLTDGRRLPGSVLLDDSGRLRFTADRSTLAADRVRQIRFSPAPPTPFRAGVTHLIQLPGGQRLSGELLGLGEKELLLRTRGRDRLAVPRGAVVGVTSLPGKMILCDEDFENGLKAWKTTGEPRLTEKHTSGASGLLLDAPGQSAAYALSSPLEAGGVAVNFHVPDGAAGARWQLEAEFRGSDGPKVLRVTLADDAGDYAVEAPAPRDEGGRVPRKAGWHRLGVEFAAESLLVTVDDNVLWYSRRKGPGGPLREVRLACAATKGAVRGAVVFDEFTLMRAVEVLERPAEASSQDEIWLASGDQLFGRVKRLDRRGVELEGRFGRRDLTWAEARGVFPRPAALPPATTDGAQVRVWLRPAAGNEPDELEGVLRALDERRLTLRHPALGELVIDRARLIRLRPLFHGKRIELDNSTRHLGEKGRLAPGVRPAKAEGPAVEYRFRLDARPASARLVLTLRPIDARAELVVNGHVVDDLARYAGGKVKTAARVAVPLPGDGMKAGENVVELRIKDRAGRGGSCLVSEVVVEVPE